VARMIVEVMLKPEIHDPQGEAIASACHRLGFGQVLGVRQGKRFEVELDGPADEAAVTAITNLARDLLSNPVIEDFTLRAGERRRPGPAYGLATPGFGRVNGESFDS
jgi:phosphoribosylformylglycinamidine synthase, purS protein